ncbi:MAG: LysM peptidoglycan-binding domain-containing protein [Acidobacteriota bacterium]|nr:LysM peptidoglycan-binding domain-containing protein [Acidobacteriota bacterium]
MSNPVNAAGIASSAVSAYLQTTDYPLPPITFQYNPSGLKEDIEARFRKNSLPSRPGGSGQIYIGTGPSSMNVAIQLDAFAIPPVPPTAVIAQLKLMMNPTLISLGQGQGRPPMVMFGWGANVIMDQAVITKLSISHERFLLGVPTRATATVTLMSVPLGNLPGTNPTSGGLATRRTRTVVEGDSLASIAYQEYEDPNYWRALAEANGIDDPMRIKTGMVLLIPEKRDAQTLLGETV